MAALTFFLDYQIGRHVVADALRTAGARVEVHIDHFPMNVPDTEWIPQVAARDWVLITKDQHIPCWSGKPTGMQACADSW